MEELIRTILRLWDPYDLRCFPIDEYDSYAKLLWEFINDSKKLTYEELTDYVYKILQDGMKTTGKKSSSTIVLIIDKSDCERFARLYFEIMKLIKE